jgi:hypothetical protein
MWLYIGFTPNISFFFGEGSTKSITEFWLSMGEKRRDKR